MTVPMIVDVDTGIDDSLALLYLLASEDAEILGIASTAGNVPVNQVAANNLAWLDLCRAGDVEVSLGAQVPLVAPLMTTEDTHGPQGIGYAELPVSTRSLSDRDATTMWVELVRSRPGEITGLVTGPLTNLALAIRRDPELPRLLKRLVLMGGAFQHQGNTTPTTEWNIAVDPEAAAEVFAAFSGLPPERHPIVCALDITETIEMTPDHIKRLAGRARSLPPEVISPDDAPGVRSTASNPIVRHFSDAVRFYMEFHRDHDQGFLAHSHARNDSGRLARDVGQGPQCRDRHAHRSRGILRPLDRTGRSTRRPALPRGIGGRRRFRNRRRRVAPERPTRRSANRLAPGPRRRRVSP